MTNRIKGRLIRYGAVALDVGAPLIATMTQFPVWVDKSADATVSGMFLFLAALCCIPFFRQLREVMKNPANPFFWIIVVGILVALRKIIDEMILVGVVAAIANITGAFLYKWGQAVEARPEQDDAPTE